MPDTPNPSTDGLITRRAALGGLMTAVLTPALIAQASAANPVPAAPINSAAPAAGMIASSPTARMLHTATALPNGTIVIAGGVGRGNRALSSVQIYDPAQDAWLDAAPMGTARFQHAATLLSDGRVLVTGGLHRSASPLSGGEIYNPALNSWTPAAAMSVPRYGHALTAMPDGRVIVSGGCQNNPISGVEIFFPNAAA